MSDSTMYITLTQSQIGVDVEQRTILDNMEVELVVGGGLSKVHHDENFSGDGTVSSKLKLSDEFVEKVDSKQDALTAGTGIKLEDNVISGDLATNTQAGIIKIATDEESETTVENVAVNPKQLSTKISKHPDIIPGTSTKITYDKEGFVTEGTSLSAEDIPDLSATYVTNERVGAASGVAELGSDGKVPTSQLPSYVDDVIDSYIVAGSTELSAGWLSLTEGGSALTPESGKIYVVLTQGEYQNKTYRWSGSTYVEISSSPGQATETQAGIAEIATTSEVTVGVDDTRIVTPLKLHEEVTKYLPLTGGKITGILGIESPTSSMLVYPALRDTSGGSWQLDIGSVLKSNNQWIANRWRFGNYAFTYEGDVSYPSIGLFEKPFSFVYTKRLNSGEGLYNTLIVPNKQGTLATTDDIPQIQFSTMPTPGEEYLDQIVQFVGATDSTYTNGYFYKCVSDGQDPAVYSWSRIDVQPDPDLSGYLPLTGGTISGDLNFLFAGQQDNRKVALRQNWITWGLNIQISDGTTYAIDQYGIWGGSGTKTLGLRGNRWKNVYTDAISSSKSGENLDITVPHISGRMGVQLSTMPTPAEEYLGHIYQYTGDTDANYVNGYFYKCVSDGQDPATYSWVQTDVQSSPDPLPDQTDNAGKFLTTDGTSPSWSDKPVVNNSTNPTGLAIGGGVSNALNYSVQIGYGSFAEYLGAYYAVGIGYQAKTGSANSIAIGANAVTGANVPYSIQLGSTGSRTVNNNANTFKVANQNGNFEIMSADGTIPEARLADTTSAAQGQALVLDSNLNAVWGTIDTLPAQSGHSGEFLTTDGTNASWSGTLSNPLSVINTAHSSQIMFTVGTGDTPSRYFTIKPHFEGQTVDFGFGAGTIMTLWTTYLMPSNDDTFSLGSSYRTFKNIYTKKINNGGDITVPSVAGSMTVQVSSLPTASSTLEGQIYQFVGATDSTYTNGYFYKCVSDGQDPATYSWERVNVQPGTTYTAGNGISIDANNEISVADPVLTNNASGFASISVGGGATAQYYNTLLGVSSSVGNITHAISIGYDSGVYSNYGLAIGKGARVGSSAQGAIQIGSNPSNTTVNYDANTFKVANANGNYEMMSADGTIPTDRFTTTPVADGTYVPTLSISSGVATRSWTAPAGGSVPTLTWYTVSTAGSTLTIADTSSAQLVKVYKNGLLLEPTADYSISGTTLTMVTALVVGDKITTEVF